MAKYDPEEQHRHSDWPVGMQWSQVYTWLGRGPMAYHITESRWSLESTDEEMLQRVIRGVVHEVVRSEFEPLLKELEGLRILQRRVQTGEVVLVPTAPLILPDFPQADVEACKAKILAEHPESGILDPFVFAETHDLDLRLVLLCFELLRKEGRLEEVRESQT